MRTFLGKRVNRETEQAFLNLITTFLQHGRNRISIFVRKNRQLGRIYVERLGKNRHVINRCYYSTLNWVLEQSAAKQETILKLFLAYRNARSIGILLDEHTNIQRIKESYSILAFG